MAQGRYKSRPTPILSAEKKTPESRFLVLKKCFPAGAAAILILSAGLWIWQNNFQEKPSEAGGIANEIHCSLLHVVVRSPDHADSLVACEGARDAIEFLAAQGLDVTADIAIDLLTRLPAVVSP